MADSVHVLIEGFSADGILAGRGYDSDAFVLHPRDYEQLFQECFDDALVVYDGHVVGIDSFDTLVNSASFDYEVYDCRGKAALV